MSRRRYSFDEKKIARFEKEGRGKGRGVDYKPWLTIQDVPSTGREHRIKGLKTGRIHDLLSDIERNAFYLFDWSDRIIDIREQFPLDRTLTQRIAAEIGVQHPRDRDTKTPLVMTTDFRLDLERDGRLVPLARTAKPAEKLDDPRVIEKFEIERRYWAEQKIDWGIVTKRDIPLSVVRNIEWIHNYGRVEDRTQPYPEYNAEKAAEVLREMPTRQSITLRQFCVEMDDMLAMERGMCLMLFRHLLATKAVRCDMAQAIHDELLLDCFDVIGFGSARISA